MAEIYGLKMHCLSPFRSVSMSFLCLIFYVAEVNISILRYHVWTKGHAPTNFAKWRTATTPYKVGQSLKV